jgi:O-antigen ligase
LLVFIFLLMAYYLDCRNRFSKAVFLIFFIIALCHILIASSRTAIFVYFVVFLLFLKDMISEKRIKSILVFVVINLICLSYFALNHGVVRACLDSIFIISRNEIAAVSKAIKKDVECPSVGNEIGNTATYALSTRYDKWKYTIRELIKNPLMGVGFKNDMHAYHNLYLEMISRAGIIGGGSFLFFLFLWIRRVSASTMGLSTRVYFFIQKGLLYGIAAWLIQSFTETFFLQFYIWAVLALGTAIAFLPFEDDKIG